MIGAEQNGIHFPSVSLLSPEFAHLRITDGDTDTLQPLPEHGEASYRPPGYAINGPRRYHYDPFMDAQTLMSASMHRTRSSGSGSGSGSQSSPYASTVGASPPASLSLQRHSSSGSNRSPRSPTASMASRASRASTLTAGSYSILAGRRVMDEYGRPSQSPSDHSVTTDRLRRLSSKLKRGSVTSLNTLTSIHSGMRDIASSGLASDAASLYSVASRAMNDSSSLCSSRSRRKLESVPSDMATSQQSFRNAMDNPCEQFFVDVM